jgi:hypothetical protein
MNMFFILKNVGEVEKKYNSEVCVKESTSNEFEVDYYRKLQQVIKYKRNRVKS